MDTYSLTMDEEDREYLVLETDDFFVNQRPIAKIEKAGINYDASGSKDPDSDSMQYKFKVNGQDTNSWTNIPTYPASGVRTISVKVRDQPFGGSYDDGLETSWEEYSTRTRTKLIFKFLLEKYPNIFEFFQNLGLLLV
jgi:hypothetical protein